MASDSDSSDDDITGFSNPLSKGWGAPSEDDGEVKEFSSAALQAQQDDMGRPSNASHDDVISSILGGSTWAEADAPGVDRSKNEDASTAAPAARALSSFGAASTATPASPKGLQMLKQSFTADKSHAFMPAVPSIQQLVNVEHINPEDLQYNILQINRAGLANKLEAKNFQLTMLVLLMIDCFFIFLELLFLYKVIDTKNGKAYGSLLHKFCVCILFFFLLESLMLIYCFAFRFFKHFWYTLDLIIVLISLVFDLLIKVDSASLIMVVRLWRVIRIIHGVSATRHELKHMAAKEKAKNESLIEDLEARENMIKSKLARLESSSTGENLTLVLEMKKDMESMEEKLHEFIDREKQLMEENEALRERLISLAPTPISDHVAVAIEDEAKPRTFEDETRGTFEDKPSRVAAQKLPGSFDDDDDDGNDGMDEGEAARVIQARHRGRLVRRGEKMSDEDATALNRGKLTRRGEKMSDEDAAALTAAATSIQARQRGRMSRQENLAGDSDSSDDDITGFSNPSGD